MSDEIDYKQLADDAARRLRDLLDNNGKKIVRHVCKGCGERSSIEVEVADPETLIKLFSASSQAHARSAKTEDDSSQEALKLIRDRSDLSDAELAEYIARLEQELRDSQG